MRKGLVFAMEEGEIDESSVELVPETQAEAEAASAEVTEQSEEIGELAADTGDATDDAGTLGDIQDVMVDSVEEGEGLDEPAAEIAEIAVEAICRRLGIESRSRVMPSMESFGSKTSRLAATKVAIEGFTDVIKRIWEAIKAAVLRVWEMIKSFFIGMTKNAKSVQKHLQSLEERLKDLPDTSKPADKELKNEGVAKAFSMNGKCTLKSALDIIEQSDILLQQSDSVITGASGYATAVAGVVTMKGGDISALAGHKTKFANILHQAFQSMASVAAGLTAKQTAKSKKYLQFGTFTNNRTLYFDNSITGKIQTLDFHFAEYDGKKKVAEEAESLNKQQCYELLKAAIKLTDGVIDHEKNASKSEKFQSQLRSVSEEGFKAAASMQEASANARELNDIARDVKELNSMSVNISVQIPTVAFSACKEAADYVSASIANMKAKKKD